MRALSLGILKSDSATGALDFKAGFAWVGDLPEDFPVQPAIGNTRFIIDQNRNLLGQRQPGLLPVVGAQWRRDRLASSIVGRRFCLNP